MVAESMGFAVTLPGLNPGSEILSKVFTIPGSSVLVCKMGRNHYPSHGVGYGKRLAIVEVSMYFLRCVL